MLICSQFRPGHQHHLSGKTRSGFSLIEAAIVLGVIGLVIGGIWIGAQAINDRRNATDMKEFLGWFTPRLDEMIKSNPTLTSTSNGLVDGLLVKQYPNAPGNAIATDTGGYVIYRIKNTYIDAVTCGSYAPQCTWEMAVYFLDSDFNYAADPATCTAALTYSLNFYTQRSGKVILRIDDLLGNTFTYTKGSGTQPNLSSLIGSCKVIIMINLDAF